MSVDSLRLQNINNVNFKQNMSTDTIQKTEPYPNDSVEIQSKKKTKKKNKLKKWAIGIGTACATLIGAALIVMSRDKKHIEKLYKEKLVLCNLPEKIDFKEAKTLDEAIKFAKETLGVKEVDQGFTLEALNIANRGLVDVSNAHKGKLFIPKRLGYEELEKENTLAYVIRDIKSERFGDLVINKRYFNDEVLNKEMEELLYFKDGSKYYNINQRQISSSIRIGAVCPLPKGDLAKLIEKFYKDKSSLSIPEKQTLFHSLMKGESDAAATTRSPLTTLKKLAKEKSNALSANNIKINFAEVEKMTTEKQNEYLMNIINKLEKNGEPWVVRYDIASPASTVHHEMGHLQDFAKNLKELHIKQDFGESFNQAREKVKNGENTRRIGIQELDNRWGSIEKEYYKNLFDKEPKKFKKWYPELYEFLTNQEIQQTAGQISGYAQSGIGEFVAETYADMIAGRKISDDVMKLYRRYNGPEFM